MFTMSYSVLKAGQVSIAIYIDNAYCDLPVGLLVGNLLRENNAEIVLDCTLPF